MFQYSNKTTMHNKYINIVQMAYMNKPQQVMYVLWMSSGGWRLLTHHSKINKYDYTNKYD